MTANILNSPRAIALEKFPTLTDQPMQEGNLQGRKIVPFAFYVHVMGGVFGAVAVVAFAVAAIALPIFPLYVVIGAVGASALFCLSNVLGAVSINRLAAGKEVDSINAKSLATFRGNITLYITKHNVIMQTLQSHFDGFVKFLAENGEDISKLKQVKFQLMDLEKEINDPDEFIENLLKNDSNLDPQFSRILKDLQAKIMNLKEYESTLKEIKNSTSLIISTPDLKGSDNL